MAVHELVTPATDDNFDEDAYLRSNPDVAQVVRDGHIPSGRSHFDQHGRHEGRLLRLDPSLIDDAKRRKHERIRHLLRSDMEFEESPMMFDFLSDDLRAQFNIVDTDAVSGHGYDAYGAAIIQQNVDGFVLDCGSGRRPTYYDNVVNFEIAAYDTTDVRGVGEALPFVDGAFDAVLSIAVLEHVKDPFACAREIARVLKPGGRLMCCVPFLQPYHGYPHHYYNMTHQGLTNLFADHLEIDDVTVYESIVPIWSLTWILRSWSDGLTGATRDQFLDMRVADLIADSSSYLDQPFVTELSKEKNLELASATVLFAHRRH